MSNAIGRCTSMVDASGSTTWLYDSRGRVVKETKVISGTSFVTEWTYNSADLPVTMTYPGGEIVTTAYNSRMLPASVSGAGPSTGSGQAYAQSIAYDSANRMIQLVRGANKINTVFNYNPWNADGGRLQNFSVAVIKCRYERASSSKNPPQGDSFSRRA